MRPGRSRGRRPARGGHATPRSTVGYETPRCAILVEDGYAAVTMEAVARRADVAHTTVYRRWPSKAHLVHGVLFPGGDDSYAIPSGAGVEEVVTGLVVGIVENFSRPEARAGLPGLMTRVPGGRIARRPAGGSVRAGRGSRDRCVLRRRRRPGEARPGLDGATLVDTIMGFAVVSAILHPDQSVDERSRGLLDLLLNGALGDVTPP